MLGPYRVLDLTDRARVALRPDPRRSRRRRDPGRAPGRLLGAPLGPFVGDVVDPERSLYWWAYDRNKRSDHPRPRHTAKDDALPAPLASRRFLIESTHRAPGRPGLDHAALAASIRARHVSISPSDKTAQGALGRARLDTAGRRRPSRPERRRRSGPGAASPCHRRICTPRGSRGGGLSRITNGSARAGASTSTSRPSRRSALATQSYILCDAVEA